MGDVFLKIIIPDTVLKMNLCWIREYKYHDITSTIFVTGSQNIRRVDFRSLAYFNLPGS